MHYFLFAFLLACVCVSGISGKKFFVDTTQTVDWHTANNVCVGKGMKLARVTSEEENTALLHAIGRPYVEPVGEEVWTAGHRVSGSWIWKTTGEQIHGYSNWLKGQPSDGHDENCLAYFHRGAVDIVFNEDFRWNDKPCYMLGYIACEYEES